MVLNRAWINHPLVTHMTANGTHNMIGDYSVTPVEAKYTAPQDLIITHFMVLVEDVGKMDSSFYGNAIVLTNGIRLVYLDPDGVELFDMLDGQTISVNPDWARFAEGLELITWGTGNEHYVAHFEFYGQWGIPFYVPKDHSVAAILADDFTGLVQQHFAIVGTFV